MNVIHLLPETGIPVHTVGDDGNVVRKEFAQLSSKYLVLAPFSYYSVMEIEI